MILNEFLNNEYSSIDIVKFNSFLSIYKENNYIYPDVLKRNFGISKIDYYKIMDILEKDGYVSKTYQIRCPYCYNCQFYEQNINDKIYCEKCDNAFSIKDHASVIYKIDKRIFR